MSNESKTQVPHLITLEYMVALLRTQDSDLGQCSLPGLRSIIEFALDAEEDPEFAVEWRKTTYKSCGGKCDSCRFSPAPKSVV